MDFLKLAVGLILAALVSIGAFKLKALDASGAWAAFILGSVVFGLGGLAWALVLMAFFLTSSGLSMLFKKQKAAVEEKFSKGSRRDARQVLANGGLAGLAVIAHIIFPDSVLPWLAFSSAFAAANADTWATELGVLNRNLPRLITNGKQVPAGTSGGVSLTGILAAIGGALIIAVTALIALNWTGLKGLNPLTLTILILIAGLIGSLIDSLIGATIQGIYWCPGCKKETEKHPLHHCGTLTELVRGKKWITNDWVNMICTGSAIIIALMIGLMMRL